MAGADTSSCPQLLEGLDCCHRSVAEPQPFRPAPRGVPGPLLLLFPLLPA